MKKILLYGSISGIIASLVIGFYFKWIERIFHIKVYTLLLNIDYFPILKHIHFSEMIEFLFHIIVSIIIATILLFITHYFKWSRQQIGLRIILISMFIGLIIYPTTILSERTPEITSLLAISHWIIGHLLYGISLAVSFTLMKLHNKL